MKKEKTFEKILIKGIDVKRSRTNLRSHLTAKGKSRFILQKIKVFLSCGEGSLYDFLFYNLEVLNY